jgi:hypothetical protein
VLDAGGGVKMVAEIINLNKFRKNNNRDIKEHQANGNRVKFGLTKVEKVHNEFKEKLEEKKLTSKKLDNNGPDVA